MERADYVRLYAAPESYHPPEDINRLNTYYPNLNSKEYRQKPQEKTLKLNYFCESLSVNNGGLAILASNDIQGRVWNGSIWGFESLKNIDETQCCFKLQSDSPVTKLMFTEDRIFLVCQMNGAVNIWSTQSEARDARGYCLFMIGEKKEHSGSVLDMDFLSPGRTKFVTGANDCSIKIWDIGAADLTCISSMNFTHSDDITSVSSSPSMSKVFASCSRDKSALVWDHRLARPAKALLENHPVGFSTICWYNTDGQEGLIWLGDDSGHIYKVDPKMPTHFIDKLKVFDRPIRKVSFNNGMTAVIGNINAVHVYNSDYNLVYTNEDAKDLLRELHWEATNSLYTIGWNREIGHHSIELKI